MSAEHVLQEAWAALDGEPGLLRRVRFAGEGDLPSAYDTTGLAAGSVAAASLALAEYAALPGPVTVDRRLASLWFGWSFQPVGWTAPAPWDPVAGDYRTADGWIRLHTNAPHHRAAALSVLGDPAAQRDAVAEAVANRRANELEAAVVAAGGCAATMRSPDAWAAHPQGRAVASEPLIAHEPGSQADRAAHAPLPGRPLAGLRVLDLTRVLAGPVATRFLAGWGAEVLRIDPPGWDEPGVVPDVTPGKRCARLDATTSEGATMLHALLARADVLVHGYRPGALDRLGLPAAERRRINPGLVDVSLDAYGWTGPWAGRRGFDSLVQMSSGIAQRGMAVFGRDRPTPLPVQALDHATGYLMAAAALRGLTRRRTDSRGNAARASLARTAALLAAAGPHTGGPPIGKPDDPDYAPAPETTRWGPMLRLTPPMLLDGAAWHWSSPATPLGAAPPAWRS